jgi:hypothetical protein
MVPPKVSAQGESAFALFAACVSAFVATAAIGVWAAYDRDPAFRRFGWLMAAGGLALALPRVVALDRARLAPLAWGLCVPLAAGIALVGLAAGPESSHAAAGALAVLLPLAASGVWQGPRRGQRLDALTVATWLSLILGLAAVVWSGEGAAWAGLAVAALFAVWVTGALGPRKRPLLAWASGALVATMGMGAVAASLAGLRPLAGTARRLLPAHFASRLELWHDAASLIQDYVFTGSGLGSTGLVLSSYVYQLHVPFTEHVHHLFLQMAVEQGVLGCVAFLGMLATSGRALAHRLAGRDPARYPRSVAAAASLVALVVYGMAESDLYCSPLVPALFLPFGLVWTSCLGDTRRGRGRPVAARVSVLAAVSLFVAVAGALVWRLGAPQMAANAAAVAQTRAELSVYRWPEWGIQDVLRRHRIADLGPAIAGYQAVLSRDPGNVTALRRLGQIELSRGEYQSAEALLERAYAFAPGQRATRQMLGELRALDGDIDAAARLWSDIDARHGQLQAREWWYAHLGAATERERIRQAIERIAPVTETAR